MKAKDKLPTEVSEDESGEKPHLITAVINDMKEKMKKKNEELRQKNSSHEPEISGRFFCFFIVSLISRQPRRNYFNSRLYYTMHNLCR